MLMKLQKVRSVANATKSIGTSLAFIVTFAIIPIN